jgi:FAD binding domain of DNA photolyase
MRNLFAAGNAAKRAFRSSTWGIRQLWATGWMHNRVRMLVASFLTKNMRQHWLEGAHWFWDTLQVFCAPRPWPHFRKCEPNPDRIRPGKTFAVPMKKMLGLTAGAIAWFALVAQLFISIQLNAARGGSVATGIWMYFAFFTVTTNLLVALTLTTSILAPNSRIGRFLGQPASITGATASIILVGIVYNTLLGHLYHQQGWRIVTDLLMHDVVQILTIAYWWISVPRGSVPWKSAACWALYPVAYFAYATARGLATGFYPYYFLNVSQLGIGWVLLNAIGVFAAFLIVLCALLALKASLTATRAPEPAA